MLQETHSMLMQALSCNTQVPTNPPLQTPAMAPAQKAWRDEVRSTFRGMTAAVAQLAHVSLPHPSLLQQLPRLHTLRPEFRRVFHSRRLQYDPVFCRTQYGLFVTDFVALLRQLVQQLDRLGARLSHATPPSVGTDEEDLFWELWQYLAAASRAFKAVTNRGSDPWPVQQQPFYGPLYNAFHTALLWLLTMTRSPAWLAMQEQHGRDLRDRELMTVLEQPIECLVNVVCDTPPDHINSHLLLLPPSFIPLLCCIMAEQFTNIPLQHHPQQSLGTRAAAAELLPAGASLPLGTAPAGNANNTPPPGDRQATTYRDAVHVDRKLFRGVLCYPLASLMLLVNNLHTHQQSSAQGSIGRCFFLTSPSILALFKMVLLLPQRRLVGSPTELNDSLDVLCGLLELQAAQSEATKHLDRHRVGPGHVQDYAVPDPPPHLAQPFADRALETDVRVLRVLSSDARGADARRVAIRYDMQRMVVQHWMAGAGQPHARAAVEPRSEQTASTMAGSVVGLAKQCMRLSMEVLEDGRWQRSFQAKLVAVDPQKRGKQQKLEAKRQRNAEALTGAELTLTRSNLVHLTVRDLLNEISAFSVPTPERIAHAEMADPRAGKPK